MSLEQLYAIEDIKRLMARRVRALDAQDWDIYRSLHADDHLSYGFVGAQPHGPDEMVATLKRILVGVTSCHMVHTPDIVLTSADTAEGQWYLEDRLWWKQNGEDHWLRGYGLYEDAYGLRDGVWKFTRRRLTRIRVDVSPGGHSPLA